jgi:hypothetical protein
VLGTGSVWHTDRVSVGDADDATSESTGAGWCTERQPSGVVIHAVLAFDICEQVSQLPCIAHRIVRVAVIHEDMHLVC